MQIISKYFPNLSAEQLEQYGQLQQLYTAWNNKINVISRQDLDNLYERHVLHSLAIAKFLQLPEQCSVLDIGTGGGFPGIPLAILFPATNFHLIDGTSKKIRVVKGVAKSLGLTNVQADAVRAEEIKKPEAYQFIITRAVAKLELLWKYAAPLLGQGGQLVCLKGGELTEELAALPKDCQVKRFKLPEIFQEEFFVGKELLIISRS